MTEAASETALAVRNETPVKLKRNQITLATLRLFLNLNNKPNIRVEEMAERCQVAHSTISRWRSFVSKGKFDQFLERAKRLGHIGPSQGRSNGVHRPTVIERGLAIHRGLAIQKTAPKMSGNPIAFKCAKLKSKGRDAKYIAAKLGISVPQFYYHMAKFKQFEQRQEQQNSNQNSDKEGVTHARGFNKDILTGIAYAETERFIANIGERIGLAPQILRRRLPELLATSPLWK